jgi:hypothetical protein
MIDTQQRYMEHSEEKEVRQYTHTRTPHRNLQPDRCGPVLSLATSLDGSLALVRRSISQKVHYFLQFRYFVVLYLNF